MTELFLGMFRSTIVLEGCFESSSNGVPVVFIGGSKPRVVLVKGLDGPVLNPVFDVFSLNEP